jgi:hypothetical protein
MVEDFKVLSQREEYFRRWNLCYNLSIHNKGDVYWQWSSMRGKL